jgi:hypothetical protein
MLKKNDSINHFLKVSGILSLDYILAMTNYCYLKLKSMSNFITPVEFETLKQVATDNDFKIKTPQ